MKICICGYGSIGQRHGKILSNLGYNFDIISLDYPHSNGNYNYPYDIVFICTPTAYHISEAMKFVNCNYFFIEKSLDSNFDQIHSIENIFKNKKIYVGYNLLYTNFYSSLKKKVKELNNNICYINIVGHSYLPKWRPKKGNACYSFHKQMGGGIVLDSSHEFNYIYNLFGEPLNIFSHTKRLSNNITVDCEDFCVSVWEYENFIVKFDMNFFTKKYTRFCELFDNDGNKIKLNITKKDINDSYIKQNNDILNNKIYNSYNNLISFNNLLKKMIINNE